MIIDGRKIAAEIIEKLKQESVPERYLAVFLVGSDPSSLGFIKQKEKIAKELGVDFRLYKFEENISEDDLRKEIHKITDGKACGGVIIQLPLPKQINAQYVLNAMSKEKDIDVLGERALGAFYAGRNAVLPPSVGVVEEILKRLDFKTEKSAAAVVGLGKLVGKPVETWLTGKSREIYLIDEGGDLNRLKDADLVICGTGVPGLIKNKMLKEGSLVIDFGYGIKDGKASGDFDPEESRGVNYTPTPGGTGPILVAKIFYNFYKLSKNN
ncbi:bifunctional 5,10-methylenetetrahydrofolate dehydrogenase/5,10-methenyltetrahydrofolate cyclohydrolase [Patescibacteria group bacterium]|nr:bifunctional 5,10-methylenetetrahydrofolate dehydrogenase/5,10-methenyltetrahydrofolate cyclohydrolase [Patescibacteria group bacterium]